MAYIDFVGRIHTASKRNYVERVVSHDKAACAEVARQWGKDYWDGERQYGYGGYHYDGRWLPVAEEMAAYYGLKAGDRVLDVGCGKGFLLYEFTRAVPGIEVAGLDISAYAVEHAKPELAGMLEVGDAASLPYPDGHFDFVYSVNTLHNLTIDKLFSALAEIERVGKGKAHITVESYRDEREKANLLYWQLTCEAFNRPEEWEWIFSRAGYGGDYGCIYFE